MIRSTMDQKNDLSPPRLDPSHLIVQRGAALLDVVELPVQGRVTIGRSSSNRIVIPDPKCSRDHCELFLRNGKWVLRDLNSRNGVLLDGQRVSEDHVLTTGESIGIGACTILVSDSSTASVPQGEVTPSPSVDPLGFEIVERKSGTQYDAKYAEDDREVDHLDRPSLLFRLARTMASAKSAKELCEFVLEDLVSQIEADQGGILLRSNLNSIADDEPLMQIVSIGGRDNAEFSSYLSKVVLKDHQAILAHDISKQASFANQHTLHRANAESVICSPIRNQGKVLGVIHLYTTRGKANLTQADLEFTLAVADQLGDQLHSLNERENLELGLDRALRHVNDLQVQLGVDTELVGNSPNLRRLRQSIAKVAPSDALVLIRGESGVGKELVARAFHFNSNRKDGPFICVNCAALSESLLESELFGHEKGAFTGATARRAGKFEQAHGGTLFLDEIGEMSPEVQAKFLRVLEGQAFERVGGGEPVFVDVRVVTATNRDLEEAVREKQLRRDLFFRLQVIEITVPPLRDHAEDIPEIASHFLNRFASQAHRRILGFTHSAIEKLKQHDWPGNVRELRNVVERAVILSDSEYLGVNDIVLTRLNLDSGRGSPAVQNSLTTGTPAYQPPGEETPINFGGSMWDSFIQQNATLDDMDRLYIEAVLKATYWNKSKASRILRIERTTLDRRLKKYGLTRPGGEEDEGMDQIQDNIETHTSLPMQSFQDR